MCDSAVSGCCAGTAHVSMGLMYCFYTGLGPYLGCPNVVLASGWRILIQDFVWMLMLRVCGLNVTPLSCDTSECGPWWCGV